MKLMKKCAIILRKALDHGDSKDDGMDIFHDIEHVLGMILENQLELVFMV
jgi:hypothetical protein